MRLFSVPMDLTGEEKIIGGVLSFRQLAYIIGGGMFAVLLFFFLKVLHLPGIVCLFIAIAFFCFGLFLSFGKPKDITADEYIAGWIQWRCRYRKFDWSDET